MNTKELALIIVFVALTTALNIYGPKIPAPFAPFLFYQLWEIPIVAAALTIGPKTGLAVAGLNTLILFAVFPGVLPTGPLYNLIAELAMLIGVYAAYKIATVKCPKEKIGVFLRRHQLGLSISATVLGSTSRVLITTVANYFLIAQPSPIGFGSFFAFGGFGGQRAVLAFLPFSALFNATIALYTIPIGFIIAIAIHRAFPTALSTITKTKSYQKPPQTPK
jgi:riboflavin transporter FmnP